MRQEKKLDMQKNNTLIRNTPDQDHDQGKNQNSNRFKPIKTWSHTQTMSSICTDKAKYSYYSHC